MITVDGESDFKLKCRQRKYLVTRDHARWRETRRTKGDLLNAEAARDAHRGKPDVMTGNSGTHRLINCWWSLELVHLEEETMTTMAQIPIAIGSAVTKIDMYATLHAAEPPE